METVMRPAFFALLDGIMGGSIAAVPINVLGYLISGGDPSYGSSQGGRPFTSC
jgi:hypothetical protein